MFSCSLLYLPTPGNYAVELLIGARAEFQGSTVPLVKVERPIEFSVLLRGCGNLIGEASIAMTAMAKKLFFVWNLS